jgi:apolipoprotein N-acyltransferase
MLAAAFPKPGIAGLAWVAPGLLLGSALGKAGTKSLRIGYLGGLAYYLASLYWLLLIPYRWHGIPFAPAIEWLALSGILALFPAIWVWLLAPHFTLPDKGYVSAHSRLAGSTTVKDQRPKAGKQKPSVHALTLTQSGATRILWPIAGAAVWVALEMASARLLGGFPWDLLGVSQYQMVPLIQIASITGVYGISFLVAWVSLALLQAVLLALRNPGAYPVWLAELFAPLLIVAFLFNLGSRHVRQDAPTPRSLRITLVQPTIPQTLIQNPAADDEQFRNLLRLSEQALADPTGLLIWPEAAAPKLLRYDKEAFETISSLARSHHIWLIIGTDDAERRDGAKPEEIDCFNSSFLMSPEGKLVERYSKRSLVIFGEYNPLQHWLPFLKYLSPIEGGFTPGSRAVPFELKDLGVMASVLICFEDIFPQLARSDVKLNTDFIVNLTNDGWFDRSAAQWQHAATAVFRSVENGVPLIRCTNNGLTCWADAYGRIRQVLRDARGSIYGSGYMTVEIPLAASGKGHGLTFYTRYGDWFGWLCVGIAGIVLWWRLFQKCLRTSSGAIALAA